MDVAGEEVLPAAMLDQAADGPGHVACEVHREGDLFAAPADDARVGEGHRGQRVLDALHVGFDVQRVVLDAGLLALPFHHLDGVRQ